MKIPSKKRHTGIEVVGDMPWGTHFCQFYKTQKDLLDVLIPYFRQGLENNEYCMCITSEPFDVAETHTAFLMAIPGFVQYIEKGQIEILPYTEWYTENGVFEKEKVLSGWVSKLDSALSKGFDGLRISGNTSWLQAKDWHDFTSYEETINKVIGQYPMLVLSTYSLEKIGAGEIIDVVANHEFAIIKRVDDWILIENIQHKKTKTALEQSEEKLRSVLDNSWDVIYRLNVQTGRYEYISPSVQTIFGYSAEEIQKQNTDTALSSVHPDHIAEQKVSLARLEKLGKSETEFLQRIKNGNYRWLSNRMSLIRDEADHPLYQDGSIRDITERKQVEMALYESEYRLRFALQAANFGTWDINVASGVNIRSLLHDQMFGYQELQSEWTTSIEERHILHEDLPMVQKAHADALKTGVMSMEVRVRWPDGSIHWISSVGSAHYDAEGHPVHLFGVVEDITEHKMAEKALKDSQEKLKLALTTSNVGIWDWNLKTNEVFWDRGIIKMHGKDDSPIRTFKDFEALINEDDLLHVQRAIKGALYKGVPYNTIFRLKSSDDDPNYINIKALVYKDEEGIPLRMLGVCIDITELTRSTKKTLIKLNEELTRSNKDLQSFSYIASHDLQEPLRMVSSFTQLLALKYKNQLDETAQEYIQYAVEGANRMYELINGLLDYSRIDTQGNCFKTVDMQKILELVKQNISLAIAEKNASVTWDDLPAVFADESQIIQLVQNLVSNALKFCSECPKIHLSYRLEDENWVFLVTDNGIGIEPQYFERIFQIYQRLHSRHEYGGTGLGLAICKRIVERHKGKIWLESQPGQGSIFYFSLPKAKE